jgi:glycosyltransferase involved in cell wall biosynthesis
MLVSLIATVLNEGDSIRRLMDSIVAQSRRPDEVVICDGGSTDHTLAVLQEYMDRLPLIIIEKSGANIAEGRNAAIATASHDVIAVTDAGVRLSPIWLEKLVEPFLADASCQVVSGFFLSEPFTSFEVAMGATVLPELQDIDPVAFNPSSRSIAFRRRTVIQIGGYPEWLDYCEDLILDFRLRAVTGSFAFAQEAVAYFRPRTSLRAFLRQYYLYARGDGKANLFFRRHLIRYLTYFAVLPGIVTLGVTKSFWWFLLLLAGAAVMLARPLQRLFSQWGSLSTTQKLVAMAWVPIIRVTGDLAKMAGYPVGWLWRWRHHPPDWHVQVKDVHIS